MYSRKNKSSAPSSSSWSDWEWNATYKSYYRYRKVGDTGDQEKDWEYEYHHDSVTEDRDPRSKELAAIYETTAPPEEYPSKVEAYANYTYAAPNQQDELTAQFSRTSLGPPTAPSGGHNATTRRIRTTHPDTREDPLDHHYKVHRSHDFKFGRVFKILWTEPSGTTGTELTHLKRVKYGESAYSSIRRFVIVRSLDGHCLCLPILTYGGQGTLKKGVKAKDHCIIYTTDKPQYKKHEQHLNKSIRMVPDNPREKLDPNSRMNYAKIYTVEHNVKVWFIGRITEKHQQQIVIDYNQLHAPLEPPPAPSMTSEETSSYPQVSSGYTVAGYSVSYPATAASTIHELAEEDHEAEPEPQPQGPDHNYDPTLYEE